MFKFVFNAQLRKIIVYLWNVFTKITDVRVSTIYQDAIAGQLDQTSSDPQIFFTAIIILILSMRAY